MAVGLTYFKLVWFNCLLPLQQNVSPLVGCPGPGEREQKLERKLKLSGGCFVRGAYARSPKFNFNAYTHRLGFLCLASQCDGQTNKNTDKLCPLAPRGVDPRSPHFQGMQRWRHTTYFIQALYGSDPLLRSQGRNPPPPKKSRFCHEANEYMSPQRRHKLSLVHILFFYTLQLNKGKSVLMSFEKWKPWGVVTCDAVDEYDTA